MLGKTLLIAALLCSNFDLVSGIWCDVIYATNTTTLINSHSNYGSTNYSSNYLACWILIASDSSKTLGLTKVSFDLEAKRSCSADSLHIYNSNTKSGKNASFCGSDGFSSLYTTNNYMYLWFKTDKSVSARGFQFKLRQYEEYLYSASDWTSTVIEEDSEPGSDDYTGLAIGCVIASLALAGFVFIFISHKKKQCQQRVQSQAVRANRPAASTSTTTTPAAATASTASSSTPRRTPKPKQKPKSEKPKLDDTPSNNGDVLLTVSQRTAHGRPCNTLPSLPPIEPMSRSQLVAPRLPPIAPPSYYELFEAPGRPEAAGSDPFTDPYGLPPPPEYSPPVNPSS